MLFQKLIINELHIKPKNRHSKIDYEQIVEYIVQKNMFSQIKLQNLNLKNITINSNSKNSLKIKSVNLEDLYMKNNNLYNLNIDLKTANNHLKFTGSLFEKYNFKWNVNIKNLQEFSNYTGNIISKGNVTGNSKNLKVKGFLKISNLKFGSNEINGLKGKIDLDLSNNKISYVNTSAKQIRLNDYSIRAINLKTKIKKEKQNNEDLYLISTNINPFSVVILETYQNKVFNFKKSALKIVINPKNISSKLKLLLENQKNPINAKLNINENNEIKGQIKWNTNNLSFISTLVPEITKFKGQLNTKTNISGTLSNPVFQINATLKNASTNIPYLNLHLNNIEVVGIGNNNAIYYNSVIHSGKGILEVTGKTDFNYPLFQTNMNIEGDNFLSINTDTLKVISSPKVILYLNSDGLNVKGDVTIPRATIKSYKSNDIETLPNNVVFINNPSSLRELFVNNNNFQFNYDISFTLGNNVNIDTKNLIALMNGSIKVQTMPQGIIATGILRIVDGRYNAYGQSLTITKGNLIFTNSPITNPILDIIASRKFHSITTNDTIDGNENLVVGAHVKGTADNPQITLFSNPNNLSQKDILSYLAIGQPSDQLTGNKLDLLLRAVQAISFGNEIGNLSNGIRQKLGLSFNIQTLPYNDDTDKKLTSDTLLTIGKYLSPSLYISYSFGIYSKLSSFRIRYKLWKKLSIETESDTENLGIDLMYNSYLF